jgi:hypothetical protein
MGWSFVTGKDQMKKGQVSKGELDRVTMNVMEHR